MNTTIMPKVHVQDEGKKDKGGRWWIVATSDAGVLKLLIEVVSERGIALEIERVKWAMHVAFRWLINHQSARVK